MSSSVPAVITALESVAATALPSGAQIVNSTILPAGWESGPGEVTGVNSGITLQIKNVHFTKDAYAELGPNYKHEEQYNILCTLCAWEGGPMEAAQWDQLRSDVYTAYTALVIAIAANMTLGLADPIPRLAWPRQTDYVPGTDPFGRPSATISFEIYVEARVNSLS